MFTIAMICMMLGFFVLYNTSRKAILAPNSTFRKWAAPNPAVARSVGLALVLTAFLLLIWNDGIGVGTIEGVLMLMTVACLTIILAPLRYLNARHIAAIIAGCLIFELLIF